MIFREMSRKTKTTSRVAAEEAKKRKDQNEDCDEALVDGEEEVNVAPSHKARKVPIGDVPAAPAEPDAPRDTPTDKQGLWEVPAPLEEGSGMKPLWPTPTPPADLEKGREQGP